MTDHSPEAKAAYPDRPTISQLHEILTNERRKAFDVGFDRGRASMLDNGKIITEFKGDDVWRDSDGEIWMRQTECVEAVNVARASMRVDREALEKLLFHQLNGEAWFRRRDAKRIVDALFDAGLIQEATE